MASFNLSVALLSLIVIVLGLVYKKLTHSLLNETLLAMLIGIALSPLVFNVLDISRGGEHGQIMEMACRLTLAMALMATAFRIPQRYLRAHIKAQAVLILLVMPAMFLSSAAIIHFVAGYDWLVSLLIGAIITPTDPVLAGTIVTGEAAEKWLPEKVRNTISFEAGVNDGMAFPLVMLCLLLIKTPEDAWRDWATKTLLWETGGALVMGVLLGYVLGTALEHSAKRKLTARPAVLAFALSVGFFTVTALDAVGVNSILAVFITGLMLKKTLSRQENIEEEEIQEMMSRLFTIPVFVLFGLLIPWQQWMALGWKAAAIVAAVLLLRRLPFLLLARPLLHRDFSMKDAAFMGWFGPMGVAALFYCFYCYKQLEREEIWTLTSLMVAGSVLTHGATAWPLLKKYGKRHPDADHSVNKTDPPGHPTS